MKTRYPSETDFIYFGGCVNIRCVCIHVHVEATGQPELLLLLRRSSPIRLHWLYCKLLQAPCLHSSRNIRPRVPSCLTFFLHGCQELNSGPHGCSASILYQLSYLPQPLKAKHRLAWNLQSSCLLLLSLCRSVCAFTNSKRSHRSSWLGAALHVVVSHFSIP